MGTENAGGAVPLMQTGTLEVMVFNAIKQLDQCYY